MLKLNATEGQQIWCEHAPDTGLLREGTTVMAIAFD